MAEDRFTLFGMETPEQVRARIGRTDYAQAMNAAGTAPGRVPVALATMLGQKLGHLISGPSGEEELAKGRTDAMMNAYTRSEGKPSEYYRYLAENLHTIGDAQGAIQALEQDRQIKASQAAAAFEKEKLKVTAKKNDELYKAKQEKLDYQQTALDLKTEIDRANTEIKRLAQQSTAGVNDQKVLNMQAEIEQKNTLLAQNAEKLRQADDKIDILRKDSATKEFDAKTRRLKLGVDERIAKLRVSGMATKGQQALFKQAMGNYDKLVNSADFMSFATELVKDDPELGAFTSAVTPEDLAFLVKGEMKNLLGQATMNGDTGFDFNDAAIQAFYTAAKKYTTQGPGPMEMYQRPEMNIQEPAGLGNIGGYEIMSVED